MYSNVEQPPDDTDDIDGNVSSTQYLLPFECCHALQQNARRCALQNRSDRRLICLFCCGTWLETKKWHEHTLHTHHPFRMYRKFEFHSAKHTPLDKQKKMCTKRQSDSIRQRELVSTHANAEDRKTHRTGWLTCTHAHTHTRTQIDVIQTHSVG